MIASLTVRLGQVLALAIAVAAAIWLAELWLLAVVLVVAAFFDGQILWIAATFVFCGLLVLGVVGSCVHRRPVVYFVSRAILLFVSAAAGVRYVFDWTIAYWAVFLAALVAVIVAIVATQVGVFLS